MDREEIQARAEAFARSIRAGRLTFERVAAIVRQWNDGRNPLATREEVSAILGLVVDALAK